MGVSLGGYRRDYLSCLWWSYLTWPFEVFELLALLFLAT